jgi:DNA-binding PadR family transcriptional regulator
VLLSRATRGTLRSAMGKRGTAVATRQRARHSEPTPQPIRSPVTWALLGLVIERPGYGYELFARYQRDYGESLPITSESQIYRGLDRLVERGLAEEMPAELAEGSPGERQPKPHYRATPAGLRRYADWLVAEVWTSRNRAQALIRQLGSLSETPRLALEVLDFYEERCLREQRSVRSSPEETAAPGRSGLIARLLDEDRRLALQAILAWLQYARAELEPLAVGERSEDRPAGVRAAAPREGRQTRAVRRGDPESAPPWGPRPRGPAAS